MNIKLFGGGVDEGETYEEAMKREALEESGCKIEILYLLGYIEEHRTKKNFIQTNYIYVAKVIKDTKQLYLSEKEKNEGAELHWYTPKEILEKMKNNYDKLVPSSYSDIYSTKIVAKREIVAVEQFLEKNEK